MMKLLSINTLFAFLMTATVVDAQTALQTVTKAVPTQTIWIPLEEQDMFYNVFSILSPQTKGPMIAMITVAISTDNTVIWYDHWEDGFEENLLGDNLIGKYTKVWGDRNSTNGCAPNIAVCTDTTDILMAGNTIQILESIPIPRDPAFNFFDGGDYMLASYPVTVTKAAFAKTPGSVLAGAVEVLDTELWGDTFDIPVGGNRQAKRWRFARAYFMAKDDNTTISVNGSIVGQINRGKSFQLRAVMGQQVTTSKPVQSHLLTGQTNTKYEPRWYSLIPTDAWTDDYTTSVGDSVAKTKAHLFNPSFTTPIRVNTTIRNRFTGAYTSAVTVVNARRSAVTDIIPDLSGAQMIGTDKFLALSVTDSEKTDWNGNPTGGATYDWGFPVIPTNLLTPQVVVGLGYGCTNNNCNRGNKIPRSPIWISPVEDAFIFIDYNNSGATSGYDIRQVRRLESIRVRNWKTSDMSGALIFARKWDPTNASQTIQTASIDFAEVDIAAAWGQDPNVSLPNQEMSLDLGTAVLPFKSLLVKKWASVDVAIPGVRMRYTIRVTNVGQSDIKAGKFFIIDPALDQMNYVNGTTTYSRDLGITNIAVNDSLSGSPFPLDGRGLPNMFDLLRRGDSHDISFDVIVDADKLYRTVVENSGYIDFPGRPRLIFNVTTPVSLTSGITINNIVYLGSDGGALCNTTIPTESVTATSGSAEPVVYCLIVTNNGTTTLTNTIVADPVLKFSFPIPGKFSPNETYFIPVPSSITGNLTNMATVIGQPSFKRGDVIPGFPPVNASDPSNVVFI